MVDQILDYAPPERPKWMWRALLFVLIIATGAVIGALIGKWFQPDPYFFNGFLVLPPSVVGMDTAAKQAHIDAIRGNIPQAAAALNAQGIPISAAEFSHRMTLRDVPQTRLIYIRCTGRSFNMPLTMVNALILPYCNNTRGATLMPGTLDKSNTYTSAGFVLGGVATALIIMLYRGRSMLFSCRDGAFAS